MANIQISPLFPVGYDLFNDDTSFLNELSTDQVQTVLGGGYHHHSCHSYPKHHYSHKSYKGRYWSY